MREQVELRFYIGYPEYHKAFEDAVIKVASMLCGGCFVGEGRGYWTEDGAEHKGIFDGEVQEEHTFHLVLSCEVHKLDAVYDVMKRGIKQLVQKYGVATNWVHVQKTEFTGMHFDAQEKD